MARIGDREKMCQLNFIKFHRAFEHLDLNLLWAERKKLCPACARPMKDRAGEPRHYFGEKFCGPCATQMQEGAGPAC